MILLDNTFVVAGDVRSIAVARVRCGDTNVFIVLGLQHIVRFRIIHSVVGGKKIKNIVPVSFVFYSYLCIQHFFITSPLNRPTICSKTQPRSVTVLSLTSASMAPTKARLVDTLPSIRDRPMKIIVLGLNRTGTMCMPSSQPQSMSSLLAIESMTK